MARIRSNRSVPRRVAIFIEVLRAYNRGLVRGIAQYSREHSHWLVHFTPHGPNDPLPARLKDWKVDGILARVENQEMAEALLATGLPVIDLRRSVISSIFPTIGPDNVEVVRLAIEHLRNRGLRNFAFFGAASGSHWAFDVRADTFRQQVEEAGSQPHVFLLQRRHVSQTSWEKDQPKIERWLKKLPKPIGILTCNDDYGLQLLNVCYCSGIPVPDNVAVVGIGNDDCICDVSRPPLTSIDLNAELVGYQAAQALDEMMSKGVRTISHIMIKPRCVMERLSTEVVATDDEVVVRALRFIREHACDGIRVRNLLKHVHLSWSAIEPRVKAVIGRTIYQEIRRVKIERVKELLRSTDMPLKQVARQAGFRYPEYMMRAFRQLVGQTPSEYRKSFRY